jgi:uncharacterized protein
VPLVFEWNGRKARNNLEKHGVSFEEAASVFGDPLSLTIEDPLHPETERRFIVMGFSVRGRTLVVVHSERNDRIRMISARMATSAERRQYEES